MVASDGNLRWEKGVGTIGRRRIWEQGMGLSKVWHMGKGEQKLGIAGGNRAEGGSRG